MPGHDVREFGMVRVDRWTGGMILPDPTPAYGLCYHPLLERAHSEERGRLQYGCPDCGHTISLKARRLPPNPPCIHPVLVVDGMVCSYERYTCLDCGQSVNLRTDSLMCGEVNNPHIRTRETTRAVYEPISGNR